MEYNIVNVNFSWISPSENVSQELDARELAKTYLMHKIGKSIQFLLNL